MMNREKIAKIIRALLDKTTENGATEGEAMLAAQKAQELMQRYHIDHGVVGMEEEGVYKAMTKRTNYKTLIVKDRMASAVAKFCDCKCWLHKSAKDGGVIVFFGLKSDADFAVWLIDSLDAFAKQQTLTWIANEPRVDAKRRWEMEKAFIFGIAQRVHERLLQLVRERQAAKVSDGRSLVIVKGQIVNREFAKLGISLSKNSGSGAKANDGGAFNAGRAAGDRASFGRPVNGPSGGGVLKIGRA
jgi:hypothetical protein